MSEFETLCQNLSFTTETDSGLTPFEAELVDFDSFFNIQIKINKSEETDEGHEAAKRWDELKNWMENNLSDRTVLKFGEIETVYFVCGNKGEKVVGFKVCGVET